MKLWSFLALVGLLAGCSALPLSISIQDFNSSIAANSLKITFQKAQQAQTPPTPVQSITLEGQLTFNQSATLVFYASAAPPCADQVNGVYSCDYKPNAMDSLGEIPLLAGQPRPFSWKGTRLTQGINQGSLYIGVGIKGSLFTGGTLQFRNLVAKVAVF